MKTSIVALLAIACVIGTAMAQFGFGGGQSALGGGGGGGLGGGRKYILELIRLFLF